MLAPRSCCDSSGARSSCAPLNSRQAFGRRDIRLLRIGNSSTEAIRCKCTLQGTRSVPSVELGVQITAAQLPVGLIMHPSGAARCLGRDGDKSHGATYQTQLRRPAREQPICSGRDSLSLMAIRRCRNNLARLSGDAAVEGGRRAGIEHSGRAVLSIRGIGCVLASSLPVFLALISGDSRSCDCHDGREKSRDG
jgi:hypothetical protein